MNFAKRFNLLFSATLVSCLLPSVMHAQQVVAPLATPAPAAERQEAARARTLQGTAATAATPSGFRVGPFQLRPHASYRYLYGNGLRNANGDRNKTSLQSLSAGVSAALGSRLDFDYTATWNLYTAAGFRDTVDHSASANWGTQYQEWVLSAGHSYSSTDSPLIETGRQTQQTSHSSTFTAVRSLGSTYSLESSVGQNLRFTETFNDPMEWTVREMLNKRITPKLSAGAGLEYSYTAIERTADTASLQYLINLNWRPIQMLSLSGQVGIENRRIYTQPAQTSRTPVYSGSLLYMPVATTTIGATLSRSSAASVLSNFITETNSVSFSLGQRLLKRFQFSAAYSYAETDYKSTSSNLAVSRMDKTDSVNLGLSTTFLSRFQTSLGYQYSNNKSSASEFKVNSSQISFEIAYSF